ncbi:MAG: hypothetical protein O2954_13930 [bacterium]|nr:hypothetical protein [bacterium]
MEPQVWNTQIQAEFASGELEHVSLTRDGVVLLAPELEEVADTGEAFVWALAEDRNGRLYVATGNEGKIFALDAKGKSTLLFDSEEVAIFSLAIAPDGALYAGSSPGGLIYKIVPGKEAEIFCRTGDEHVWVLVPDGRGGLYAATGGKSGRILRVSGRGEVELVYQSTDHNVVSLIRGSDGSLYAGTDENGLVYRVDPSGKVAVLYDVAEEEVHALALGADGMLYAGAMPGNAKQSGGKGSAPPGQGGVPSKAGSVLYAIRPSGAALRLWETAEPLLLALHVGSTGEITVVTGDEGRVYRVGKDGSATLLARLADVQPWAFCAGRNDVLWMGTAGAGKVYRLRKMYARAGTLTSAAKDFRLVSRWGKMAWRAEVPEGASLAFQTRSGNSETPDDTWSEWSQSVQEAGQVLSPPARFLQYRADLQSSSGKATPRFREIRLVGLQENMPPMVLSVEAKAQVGQGNGSGPGKEPGQVRKGADAGPGEWEITWEAGDVNDDRLTYSLFYRGVGERNWKLLAEDLTTTSYRWQIDSAPEGTVQVRVVASDRASNPGSMALSAERVSVPFDLDHTPPGVALESEVKGAGTVVVEGVVEDRTSAIREAAYSVNSGAWMVFFPEDGIFDSHRETFRFTLNRLSLGEHTVVVRAVDAQGNVGVGKVVVEMK